MTVTFLWISDGAGHWYVDIPDGTWWQQPYSPAAMFAEWHADVATGRAWYNAMRYYPTDAKELQP